MALDAVSQEFSSVGSLPYDIDSAALSAARGCLYGSASDYVLCYDYDDITHTYTYTLYSGHCRVIGDIVAFSSGDVYTWSYVVDSVPVSTSDSVSGSFSGSAVGQSPAALQGTFNGSVPRVQYRYTVSSDCDIQRIDETTYPDTESMIYGSMDFLPHIERGYSYADIGQAVALPVLFGVLCSVFSTQVLRRFG